MLSAKFSGGFIIVTDMYSVLTVNIGTPYPLTILLLIDEQIHFAIESPIKCQMNGEQCRP